MNNYPGSKVNETLRLHDEGLTPREIAHRIDLSTQAVYRTLTRSRLKPNRDTTPPRSPVADAVLDRTLLGETPRSIASTLNTSTGYVYQVLREANVEPAH